MSWEDELESVTESLARLEREIGERLDSLTYELEGAYAEIDESSHIDYESWIDEIVREAEGRMLDGVSPGVILAAVIVELSDKRALVYAADKVTL